MTQQEQTHIDVIQRLTEAANAERYDEMDALFAEDYVDHNPGWNVNNVDDLKKIISEGHKNFEVTNEIIDIMAVDDMAYVNVTNKGRHVSKVFGVEPTGKPTSMTTFEIYRFEKGKIAERWVVSDVVGLMKQLGAKLPDFLR